MSQAATTATHALTIPTNINPIAALNSIAGMPQTVLGGLMSAPGAAITTAENIVPKQIDLFNGFSVLNGNQVGGQQTNVNGNGNNVSPTNTPTTASPTTNVAGTQQKDSPGATSKSSSPLGDITSALPIIGIAIAAVIGIYLLSRK